MDLLTEARSLLPSTTGDLLTWDERIRLAGLLSARTGRHLSLDALAAVRTVDEAVGAAAAADEPDEWFALSHSQQRIMFAEEVIAGDCENMPVATHVLRGPLDVTLLFQAIDDALAQHSAWTCRFDYDDAGLPRQACGRLPTAEELTEILTPVPDVALNDIVGQAAAACGSWWDDPFDLTTETPIRIRLVKLAPDAHLLCFCFHHVAVDGWSYGVFCAALGHAYRARSAGSRPTWSPVPSQRTFVEWESRTLAETRTADIDYWTNVATKRQPPLFDVEPYSVAAAGSHVVPLPAATVQALTTAARARRGMPLSTLLAAMSAELGAASGSADDGVMLGTILAGRFEPAFADTVGCFVNPVAVETPFAGERWVDRLGEVSGRVLSAMRHGRTPYDVVVRDASPAGDRSAWFQALAVLDPPSRPIDLADNIADHVLQVPPPRVSVPFALQVVVRPDGGWDVHGRWRVDTLGDVDGRLLVEGTVVRLHRLAGTEGG